jgi:hypothetical protein
MLVTIRRRLELLGLHIAIDLRSGLYLERTPFNKLHTIASPSHIPFTTVTPDSVPLPPNHKKCVESRYTMS